MMPTAVIQLKKGRDKPIRQRHPWVFSGAIAQIQGEPAPGDWVQVVDVNGHFLATGSYSPHSQIRVRLFSWDLDERMDQPFLQKRLEQAIAHRQALNLAPATTAYRLVHAEADGLPGLIVDRYGDYLVMQCLTVGIDRHKQALAAWLNGRLHPTAIIERSDVDIRHKEGLPLIKQMLIGDPPSPDYPILENNIRYQVDLLDGHKTGFYLDQRENKTAVCQPHIVGEQTVLNAFAYTGGFGLAAIAHGAKQVIHLDSSVTALEQAEANVALNGWKRPQDEYLAGDAFEVLRHYRDEGRQFDVIVLDPPKFAHSQRDVERACRGYKDLNWLAMRLLSPGGWLATFSCSGLISADLFQKVLFGAAVDAKRELQIVQPLHQGGDHPVRLTFPESSYLKGFLLRAVD